ncbi:MAG: transposase [Cyanobacteria bacterium P01_D01_bin.50]
MGKFSTDEYRHEGNAVSLLNYHFVFIPKRRKKVLVGDIAFRLQEVITELCNEPKNRWKIKEFPELLKLPTLWTPSYFVSTAGNISTEQVKRYIAQQKL